MTTRHRTRPADSWRARPEIQLIRTSSRGAFFLEPMVQIALDPVRRCRGIFCNVLVCLAVWLCMGARSVTDKILATVFPITAFVAAGISAPLSATDALSNLALVTLGNVLGGTVLVALVYRSMYLRSSD